MLVLGAAVTGGCSVGTPDGPESRDARGEAMECLREERIPARLRDPNGIRLAAGPHIQFYLTGGEAEAAGFKGRLEGAEQIGAAVLYTRGSTDDELLDRTETCLEEL